MLAYTTPHYQTHSPSPFQQPPRFVPARALPARERYLRALADAQSARERYVSELEEQRVLDGLWRQEALRQAELRQRQSVASQDLAAHRRAGQACRGQPLLVRPDAGHEAFTRQQREPSSAQHDQELLKALEELFEALLGRAKSEEDQERETEQQRLAEHRARQQSLARQRKSHSVSGNDQHPLKSVEELFEALLGSVEVADDETLKERQRLEEARAELARRAVLHNARIPFINKLDTIRKEARAVRNARTTQAVPPASPPHTTPKPAPTARVEVHPYPVRHPASKLLRTRTRAARTIQQRWRAHSADAAARREALSVLEALRARFHFLRSTFNFPEHLEFREGQESELLYTSPNAALHAYTHELTKLLMRADAVVSGGSEGVREERRNFVRGVEEELGSVEAKVAEVWAKRAGSAAAPFSHTDALQVTEPAMISMETSNTVEEHLIPAEVTGDQEQTSDSAPVAILDATADCGIPTSPSTISASTCDAYPEPRSLAPKQQQNGTRPGAQVQEGNDDTLSESHENVTAEEIIAISRAETEARFSTDAHLHDLVTSERLFDHPSSSLSSPSPGSTPNDSSASRQRTESSSVHNEDSHVDAASTHTPSRIATIVQLPVDKDSAALSTPTRDTSPSPEPFDVVYPNSLSSTSSALAADVNTRRGSQSDPHSCGAGDDAEEDGFELI